MTIVAQTPRFVIRNFVPEEEAVYLALFDDEQVIRHLPKRTRGENIIAFRNSLADYAANKTLGRWGIFNNGDNEYIGLCLLRSFDEEKGKVELGYVLQRKFWGLGIATEMALILVAYGFTHANAREIVAVTTPDNTASQKVLEKAGLERRGNILRDGEELSFFVMERKN